MHTRATKLLLASLLFLWGCPFYEEAGPPEAVADCLTPDQWVGRSCEDWCRDGDETGGSEATCVHAEECGGVAVAGYKRLDACPFLEYYTELPQSCDDPLPESLTESIYLVSCCCRSDF